MAKGFFASSLIVKDAPGSTIPQCGICGLYKGCNTPKMSFSGEGRRKILIIGEAPGKWEDEKGKQFVGKSGQYLRDVLNSLGIDMRRDCWLTNSIICHPISNKIPNKKIVEYCRPNLTKTLSILQPDVVIPLGGVAVNSLITEIWREAPGSISRWVGWDIPCQKINAWICPTYHPSYLLREENHILDRQFRDHLSQAIAHEGKPWEKLPNWEDQVEVILDADEAEKLIDKVIEKGGIVGFDYENNCLKPETEGGEIICASVCWEGKKTFAYPWHGAAIKATQRLLHSDSCRFVASNCFSGDTRFLTREMGIVSLAQCAGKRVTVLNHEGRWVSAKIKSFGKQKLVKVTFSRRNYQKEVWCTEGHRWISAENGARMRTDEMRRHRWINQGKLRSLSVGPDRVPYQSAPKVISDVEDYTRGVQHGIIMGDGSRASKRDMCFNLRLCGEKVELLSYFKGYGNWKNSSGNGDINVYLTRQKFDFKSVPPKESSDSYLIGFFRGLFATDGTVDQGKGRPSLTGEKTLIKWCLKHMPRVGFSFQNSYSLKKYYGRYSGSFKHTIECWTTHLSRDSIELDDLLRSAHKIKLQSPKLGPYKFSSREDTKIEEVFCAVVTDGNSFTLDNGLVTGNCKHEDRWTRKVFGRGVRHWAWDTMLAAHTLDNRGEISGLKFQSFVNLGQPSYDDHIHKLLRPINGKKLNRASKEIDLHQLLKYCGCDSLLEVLVAEKQHAKFDALRS